MIKIEFNADLENKGVNSNFTYKFEKTTTFEVEFLIAKLLKLIKDNDEKANIETIIKEVNVLYDEITNEKKDEVEENDKSSS